MLHCRPTILPFFGHQALRCLAAPVLSILAVASVAAGGEQVPAPVNVLNNNLNTEVNNDSKNDSKDDSKNGLKNDLNAPPAIVIGFMGGKVAHDDAVRNELIISNRLRTAYPHGVYFEVFENRRLEDAHRKILQLLGAAPSHALSEEQKRKARIILYGHSWGASTVVALADALQKEGVPVLLTIQVDSVEKRGQDDGVIPPNVARAINFYQPDGMLHGRTEIHAVDSARTQILGNFRFTYKDAPQECRLYPWYERVFIKTHIAIECDPVLWKRIETLVRETLGQAGEESATR
jgi:hypothetical protein